ALRKRQAYARAEGRLQAEPEQQPLAWVQNVTENAIRARDTRVLMAKVINSLPEAQQRVIELAFFQGMSQREIGSNTNIAMGTVKTRLELGLKKIYDGLKELKDEPSGIPELWRALCDWSVGTGRTPGVRGCAQPIRFCRRGLH